MADLLAAVTELLHELSDAGHRRLAETVDRKFVIGFGHVRRQQLFQSSQFVVVRIHVSYQKILALQFFTCYRLHGMQIQERSETIFYMFSTVLYNSELC